MKLIPALAAGLMMLGIATTVQATEWMECGDPDNEVQLGFLLGGLDFAQASRAHLRVEDEWWTTDPAVEPGKPLAIGEYFFDWKLLNASVVDENHENVLAQLQVIVATTDTADAKGGVIVVPGKGAWAVSCDGP